MSGSIPFDKVKNIPMRYKNLVMGYICKSHSTAIPEGVKLIILLFHFNMIDSSILTDKLLQLFDEQNKFKDLDHFHIN